MTHGFRNSRFLSLPFLSAGVLLLAGTSWAWYPLTHRQLCQIVLNDSRVSELVTKFGLDRESVLNQAAFADALYKTSDDFQHHPDWERYSSWDALKGYWSHKPVTNESVGFLLHQLTDAGVPLGHLPAGSYYTDTYVENNLEAEANAIAPNVAADSRYDVRRQDYGTDAAFYDAYCEAHRVAMQTLAENLKTHVNEDCIAKTCMSDWIIPDCYKAAVKFSTQVLWTYLDRQSRSDWEGMGRRKPDLGPVITLLLGD